MSVSEEEDQPTLFGVPELDAPPERGRVGRTELALLASIRAGQTAGTLVPEDAGLIAGALVAARALDAAEQGKPGEWRPQPYAVAALLTPYRETLQALRLPAAVEPTAAPPPAAGTPADASSLLGDLFGTPQPPG
jgi:hypothetical protein